MTVLNYSPPSLLCLSDRWANLVLPFRWRWSRICICSRLGLAFHLRSKGPRVDGQTGPFDRRVAWRGSLAGVVPGAALWKQLWKNCARSEFLMHCQEHLHQSLPAPQFRQELAQASPQHRRPWWLGTAACTGVMSREKAPLFVQRWSERSWKDAVSSRPLVARVVFRHGGREGRLGENRKNDQGLEGPNYEERSKELSRLVGSASQK